MDPASADLDATAKASPLYATYGTRTEAESARELLAARMAATSGRRRAGAGAGAETPKPAPRRSSPTRAASPTPSATSSTAARASRSSAKSSAGIFGMLKKQF